VVHPVFLSGSKMGLEQGEFEHGSAMNSTWFFHLKQKKCASDSKNVVLQVTYAFFLLFCSFLTEK